MLQNALIQLLKSPQAALIYKGNNFPSRLLVARALSLLPALKKIQSTTKHLAFCLPNSPDLLCYHLACFYLGLPIVPIIYEQSPEYIQQVIQLTGAGHLITTTAKNKALSKSKLHLNCDLIISDETHQILSSSAAPAQLKTFLQPSSVQPTDLAMIIFSSGTSGKLNGIMHSYQSSWGFMKTLEEVLAIDEGLSYLIAQPMGHIGGLITTLLTLVHNGTAILLENFEISSYMQAMEQYQPTHINLHTPLFYELLNYPQLDRKAFSRIKTCFAGGDEIPGDLPQQFTKATGAPMRVGYGMTEIGIVTVNPSPYDNKKGSCGKKIKLAQTEILLRDENGMTVPQGGPGEIWVQSPACCLGYWDKPVLNKKILVNSWFRTGDLAYQDSEGYYWYMGRTTQVIHRNGHTLYPQTLEQIFYHHPGIKAVAVIGIHTNKEGEVPVAFIELKNTEHPRNFKENIIKFAAKQLQPWQIPQKILLLKKLPLNLTGKIDRRALQKIYLDEAVVS